MLTLTPLTTEGSQNRVQLYEEVCLLMDSDRIRKTGAGSGRRLMMPDPVFRIATPSGGRCEWRASLISTPKGSLNDHSPNCPLPAFGTVTGRNPPH
ncbi:hypothetical protein AVEN_49616-1 [Araneus ventricosus]|uniref:Uncharacterized protein n=1 Tax=Araneus ventricosus TaxID=182803 RepID=A0A4Y2UZN2_ARAVE|nr:hypothetical protein AVEN_49616-1 [Araneus ventricosus]